MKRVPFARLFSLAARQLLRDARAGELRVLFFALLVAVAASSAIGYFSARLNDAMLLRASEFLAADLRLSGSTPASQEQIDAGLKLGLDHAQAVEFSSVVAAQDGIQLASVKAANSLYPLRGELRSAAEPYAREEVGPGPRPGEVWAEARLMVALNLKIGDELEIGAKTLRLSRVLTYDPDTAGDFYSLTPRVLMHLDDLAATEVVQPGSRVRFRELWRGDANALAAYRQAVEAGLEPNQRLEDARDGNRQVGGALGRAERYLNLASLAAVLLAGVAVALSAARFAARRFDASALLRCLGLSRREALALFGLQLALLGLLASVLGALLGWAGQHVLFHLLRGLIPDDLPPAGLWPALAGMATGLVALAGFALPPLAALGRVPPLRVLRRDMLPVPASSWLVYGAALVALGLIMWRLSLDLKLTLALLGGGLLAALVLGGLLLIGLQSLRRLLQRAALPWRLGLGQLLRHPLAAAGQSLAFGLILLAMALIALLRGELLDTWQDQLPDDAPNHFALNVLPAERDAFAARLAELSPHPAPLYPVVPGRLIMINDEPVRQLVTKESRGERAIQRDLSLTWANELPSDNLISAGSWWGAEHTSDLPGVSVEAELAESLHLQLGDRLRFNVGGIEREAQVTSLRQVDWDSFQPNFYMIFEPQTLQDLPATYLTSFYLPPGQDAELIKLSRAFPSVTLLQVDALLAQLRSILAQVTLAIEYVLLFVLAAGITVLLAGLQATLDERIRQGALLRALGAERKLLISARRAEFGLLGAAAGLLAALGCELVSFLLYRYAFDMSWQPHPWLLLLPLIGALLIGLAGVLGTRRALNASPLSVLREG
ncbi:ABC transporter permease [Ectopseudomonas guguanensis]|jgi:putative ABC transport system permease protein|uniref:ABC transporter permease n=1 Tax=Ectopseudomonas guguanensis TaxID=1198456 RepID=UPI0012D6E1D5|nr:MULTISPECIES: FtsX-like permease family protein [Pseudomonas]MPT19906.1 FtsX-like permease family protein [Pseudomonas sp.]WJH57424.1 FtsX-like permease family protein [Pseudomonas guguanensis]